MKVRLRPGDRAILEARLRAGSTKQRQLLRIRIVLEATDGHATREIARELETTPTTVRHLFRLTSSRHHFHLIVESSSARDFNHKADFYSSLLTPAYTLVISKNNTCFQFPGASEDCNDARRICGPKLLVIRRPHWLQEKCG